MELSTLPIDVAVYLVECCPLLYCKFRRTCKQLKDDSSLYTNSVKNLVENCPISIDEVMAINPKIFGIMICGMTLHYQAVNKNHNCSYTFEMMYVTPTSINSLLS